MKRALSLAVALVATAGILLQAQPPPSPADAFFDDSQVHIINLAINGRDWQALRDNYKDNTYYPCDLRWNGQVVRNIGIRSRGTGSRNELKPGLRVDFDRYVGGQTFLGLKSFILRNQTQDPSNMHERISMQLFARLGVKVSREAFAKLYISDVYWGLYSIVESVDKAFLMRSFGEDGGTLYKYDYNATDEAWYFTDKGTNASAYVPHPFKPETNENDPRPESTVEMVRVVNNDSDAVFRTTIAPYVDWDNFLKHIAIENVIADQDGFNGEYGVNNFYLYRMQNSKMHIFIPWDKSEAFKNPTDQAIFHNFLDGTPAKRNRLSARPMASRDLEAKYLDYLLAAANSLAELDPANPAETRGWMEREIEREYMQIRDFVYTDPERPFNNEQFEADVEHLRAFARERPAFVVNAVNAYRAATGR
jgi:spore coat protein CotH